MSNNTRFQIREHIFFAILWSLIKKDIARLKGCNHHSLRKIKKSALDDYRKLYEEWELNSEKADIMNSNTYFAMPFIPIYKRSQLSPAEFKTVLHDLIHRPLFVTLTSSKKADFKNYYQKLQKGAQWSQEHKQEYPHSFVYHMTHAPENGKPEAIGWTFTRCGLHELFSHEEVTEILSSFCELDYIFLERRGNVQLIRDHTIEKDGDYCDFFVYKDEAAKERKYEVS